MSSEWPQWWQEHYGSLPPVAEILRRKVEDRWFRIHSLPKSKRYPENEEEYARLLARHNTIATQILGEGALCTLFIPRYDDSPCDFAINGISPQYCDVVESRRFDTYVHIWQVPVIWQPGSFDELIRAVADWREPGVLFACQQTGRAYYPYDGGADLFLESHEQRSALKRQYSEWLSAYPGGL